MTFTAQNNSMVIGNGTTNVFTTDYRMPHILSTVSGTFSTVNSPIYLTGSSYAMSYSVIIPVQNSSIYTPYNTFVLAYIKPTVNVEKTEIDTANPIYVSGTICSRIYIENNAYRGSLLITPTVWNGSIGFIQENTYRFDRTTPPKYLDIDPTNTYVNPGITFAYTLYYGRFS